MRPVAVLLCLSVVYIAEEKRTGYFCLSVARQWKIMCEGYETDTLLPKKFYLQSHTCGWFFAKTRSLFHNQ